MYNTNLYLPIDASSGDSGCRALETTARQSMRSDASNDVMRAPASMTTPASLTEWSGGDTVIVPHVLDDDNGSDHLLVINKTTR